jgi:hypothetical protein
MNKEEIKRMREFEKVYMICVCEGKGTPESPARIIRYIYDENCNLIGEIDNFTSNKD